MTLTKHNANTGRSDHLPPPINQEAILDASISRRIENLRRHLLAIDHLLSKFRSRLDVLEREAKQ